MTCLLLLPPLKKKRGRPSDRVNFEKKQADLFPIAKYLSELEIQYPYLRLAGRAQGGGLPPPPGRPALLPPATNRGGKSK